MKNSELVAAYKNLTALVERNEKYPVRFSYAVTRNLKALEPLINDYHNELNKLFEAYGEKDGAGEIKKDKDGGVRIAGEHQEAWERDIRELLEIDVEVTPHMVCIDALPENIEPGVLIVLDFMIEAGE